jgi:glutamate carboxypeptidase
LKGISSRIVEADEGCSTVEDSNTWLGAYGEKNIRKSCFAIPAFLDLGFNAERVQAKNPFYGDHLVLTRDGQGSDAIGLVSHLDTVYTEGEEREHNFAWRVEGDRIYGPGTVDIKGGTVLIYMVLDALKTLARDVFEQTNGIILLNAGEDVLVQEFGELCRQRLSKSTKACLVFEGGRYHGNRFSIVAARKGMATYRLKVEGRAAHAGSSHGKGANAIVQLAQTISRIAEFTDYERDITFNVGTVAGGTVINRIPHLAVASGELRAYREEDLEEGVSKLMSLKDNVNVYSNNGGYPCNIEVDLMGRWRPWPPNNSSDGLVDIWKLAAREMGAEVVRESRGGLSDGNHTWQFVPTIDGLGPSGGNAHCSERSVDGSKDQEFVRISSLVPKATLNTLGILELLKSADSN